MAMYAEVFAENSTLAQLAARARRRRPTVVVADDSPHFLEIVCRLLEHSGLVEVVATAADGAQAVRAVMQHHPDLILMDIQMPSINGLLAAAILTAAYPKLAIVLMSAESSPQVRHECLDSGAHGFIDKSEFTRKFPAALTRVLDDASCLD